MLLAEEYFMRKYVN